jgi:hypothetical protein
MESRSRDCPLRRQSTLAPEGLIEPIQKSLLLRPHAGTEGLGELLKELSLFLGELGRYLNVDYHELITAGILAVQTRHSLSLELDDSSRLGSSRYPEGVLTIQSRDSNMSAQRGLGQIDIQVEENIVLATFEELVGLDLQEEE